MRHPNRLVAVALAVLLTPVIAGVTGAASISLARFTDSATAAKTITTDTLDPPTALAATGGTSVSLTWTATVDTYAAGYDVWRGTVSGGPYALIKSVTPRTTVATPDAPALGTYYYVLRSSFQNWRSVNSNQATAIVSNTTSTGYHACTGASNAADTGGNGNGYESTPANACATDAAVASDLNSGTNTNLSCTDAGKDRHRWWDFGLGVPATVTSVDGVQVRLNAAKGNNGSNAQICVQLSWNGGGSWTTAKTTPLLTTTLTSYVLGATNDPWGHSWLGSELANANFRVRVIDLTDKSNQDLKLDSIDVQVTYQP